MRRRTKILLRGWGRNAKVLEVFRLPPGGGEQFIAKMSGATGPEAALKRRPPGLYRLVYKDQHGKVLRRTRRRVGAHGVVVEIRELPRVLRRARSEASALSGTVIVATHVATSKGTPGAPTTRPVETTPSTAPAARPIDMTWSPPERPAVTAPASAPPPEPRRDPPLPSQPASSDAPSAKKSPRPDHDDVLPRRLRMLLDATGISQAELARVAKLNASHVNDICTGRRRDPSIRTVAAIASATGCSCDWLAGLVDRGPVPSGVRATFVNAGGRLRAKGARRS